MLFARSLLSHREHLSNHGKLTDDIRLPFERREKRKAQASSRARVRYYTDQSPSHARGHRVAEKWLIQLRSSRARSVRNCKHLVR